MASNLGGESDDLAEMHEINVTPFIDVMLVLLIIFMVAAPLATVDIAVELPVAAAQQTPKPDKLVFLSLKADRSLLVGETPVTSDTLAAVLNQATQGDKTQRVFIRSDKTVAYDAVMQTLDALRAAGYLKVALVGLEAASQR